MLIEAAGIADGESCACAPGAILLDPELKILAVGAPAQVAAHPVAAGAAHRAFPQSIVTPAFVNAHTHLDLSAVGPERFDKDAGFTAWLASIAPRRPANAEERLASARLGIELSRRAGVAAIGDIAGSVGGQPAPEAAQALAESGLKGFSFAEVFAIGKGRDRSLEAFRSIADRFTGISPHAPFSVEPEALATLIAESSGPIAMHVAESADERRFCAEAAGPQRDFLESLDLWEPRLDSIYARSSHPIELVADHLRRAADAGRSVLAIHCNDVPTDELLGLLASTGASVVYCPRAAADFGHAADLGPHRYREMRQAGVNVCLGTDSVINLSPHPELPGADPMGATGIGTLDDARLLYRRDRDDPRELLAMATTRGARALGLDPRAFAFTPGVRPAGLLQIPLDPRARSMHETVASPRDAVLAGNTRPEPILRPA